MKRIGWTFAILIFAPILLIVLAVFGTEVNKSYWDRKVRSLCETEGGVFVYHVANVAQSKYPSLQQTKKGASILPSDSQVDVGDPFYYKSSTKLLRDNFPVVRRYISEVVRMEDGKVLGEKVTFSRIGGDFPTLIGHSSSYSCGDVSGFKNDLFGSVINIKDR